MLLIYLKFMYNFSVLQKRIYRLLLLILLLWLASFCAGDLGLTALCSLLTNGNSAQVNSDTFFQRFTYSSVKGCHQYGIPCLSSRALDACSCSTFSSHPPCWSCPCFILTFCVRKEMAFGDLGRQDLKESWPLSRIYLFVQSHITLPKLVFNSGLKSTSCLK